MQINPSILNAKYIYLDWNVIKTKVVSEAELINYFEF